jgi:hypothetical protein
MRWSAAALLLFALGDLAPVRADETAKAPFDTIKTQHIVVMVKLNGKGPFRFIFDTGAPVTIMSTKVAVEAGILPKDSKSIGIGLLGGLTQYKIKTLELGDLKAENVSTTVMDHPTVDAISKAVGPVEGLIGLTLFGKYRTTIDYQAKQMTFTPVDFTPPNVMQNMQALVLNSSTAKKKILAPAGQWGLRVSKGAKDDAAGVVVSEVLQGGPAAAAGLKAGDRLLTLDGRWTDTVADCYKAAGAVRPGTSAPVTVLRDGKELELTVRVAAGL